MRLLGSIKIGEHTTTHTKTLNDGSKIDVLKLIDMMNGRTPHNINLNQLDAPKKKNKATGFSTKRYDKADTSYPLIVDSNNFLLDGRHRYFKLLDSGVKSTNVHTATSDDLAKVKMANQTAVIVKGNPEFVNNNPRADKFYNDIGALLKSQNYNVSYDPGLPYTEPHKANVWLGHSRGVDRLRFAPPTTKTIALGTYLQDGINNPRDTAPRPGLVHYKPNKYHFQLTDEMKQAIIARLK